MNGKHFRSFLIRTAVSGSVAFITGLFIFMVIGVLSVGMFPKYSLGGFILRVVAIFVFGTYIQGSIALAKEHWKREKHEFMLETDARVQYLEIVELSKKIGIQAPKPKMSGLKAFLWGFAAFYWAF